MSHYCKLRHPQKVPENSFLEQQEFRSDLLSLINLLSKSQLCSLSNNDFYENRNCNKFQITTALGLRVICYHQLWRRPLILSRVRQPVLLQPVRPRLSKFSHHSVCSYVILTLAHSRPVFRDLRLFAKNILANKILTKVKPWLA